MVARYINISKENVPVVCSVVLRYYMYVFPGRKTQHVTDVLRTGISFLSSFVCGCDASRPIFLCFYLKKIKFIVKLMGNDRKKHYLGCFASCPRGRILAYCIFL